jgi:hypothetical protein
MSLDTSLSRLSMNDVTANPLSHFDTLEKVVPWCDAPRTIMALSCVSRSLNQDVVDCLTPEITFKICNFRVRIINTGSAAMLSYSLLELIRRCRTVAPLIEKLAPLVEGDAGLTFLIMREGLTLRELIKIAADKGITVNINWDEILEQIGDLPIKQSYGVIITNNVFKKSREENWSYSDKKELVSKVGCEMPPVQEYVALCIFTQEMFGECLYGQNPWTYACSSTCISTEWKEYPVVVGACTPSQLSVLTGNFAHATLGAGGRQMIALLPPSKSESDALADR